MKTNLRPKRKVTRFVSIFALLGLILVSLPVFSAGQTEPEPGEVKKINLALGDIETVETLHLLIALEKVRERGIDVEMISFKSEDVAAQAVVNKQADIGIGTPYALIQNVNAPIRIFFQLSTLLFFPVVNTEFYNSWKDLDGEEMVVHSRTSGTLAIANLMAMKNGIEYGKISYVPGSEVRATSMLQGNIRATILDSFNKEFLMKEAPGKFKVLPMGEIKASDEALYANAEFLEANPTVVRILVEELVGTIKAINDDPAYVIEQREKYGLLPDLPSELEPEILPFYELAAEGNMFPEDGGGAEAAKQDFEFYGVAGQIQGDPASLKVEDFWYLKAIDDVVK
ncbi:MAG: ABC transporter substrate-binding protein [Spirochaetales bacterium]|nr:ABC transporter substrate-binding protein [Spirochaetales bacterium]